MNKYTARLLFRVEPYPEDTEIEFFESIILVEAESSSEAWERSEQIGRERGRSYECTTHHFVGTKMIMKLRVIDDGVELSNVHLTFEKEPQTDALLEDYAYCCRVTS